MSSPSVFVSYSSQDRDWVQRTLVPELEHHGFHVVIDFRDFPAGKLGIHSMEEAVLCTNRTLIVLTPAYLASEWTTFENVMAQSLDPAARTRKVIPVLRLTCEIPLRLRILHYRDLRTDNPTEWDLLMRDLI